MDQEAPGCARCPYEPQGRICQNEEGKAPPFCPTVNKEAVIAQGARRAEKTGNPGIRPAGVDPGGGRVRGPGTRLRKDQTPQTADSGDHRVCPEDEVQKARARVLHRSAQGGQGRGEPPCSERFYGRLGTLQDGPGAEGGARGPGRSEDPDRLFRVDVQPHRPGVSA